MLRSFLSFLFPSWKFFDETFEIPFLLYRTTDESEWTCFFPPTTPKFYQILYNPQINLSLLCQTHTHRILNDILKQQDQKDFNLSNNEHFLFFNYLVKTKIAHQHLYQFKLSYLKFNEIKTSFQIIEDVLISPEFKNEL